ncbi:hypothetical protein B0H13DRAFT_513699 [Mycena leptocephala]|nr:hypothetical protein B0H13DRAFT_513699 [Mycena leptocephala]
MADVVLASLLGWTISSAPLLKSLYETGSSTPDRKPHVFRSLLFTTSPSTPALEHPPRLCLAQRVHTTTTLPALVALWCCVCGREVLLSAQFWAD